MYGSARRYSQLRDPAGFHNSGTMAGWLRWKQRRIRTKNLTWGEAAEGPSAHDGQPLNPVAQELHYGTDLRAPGCARYDMQAQLLEFSCHTCVVGLKYAARA